MGENRASFKNSIPKAGWSEYLQWFLRRRRRFVVREMSMVPTLMPGDTVLASMNMVVRGGDIAIASHPTKTNVLLIKRVQEIFCDGGVYLISDNAKESNARDSRHFGVIQMDQILGRVTSRLASVSGSTYSFDESPNGSSHNH